MSVKWEKEEGTNNGKLTFEIEPAKIKEGLDVAFNRVKKSLNVPGFRKGKVPRQIFNKMFGEESLYQDALNAVLPEAYTNAVKESDIKPVDQPEIDVESMEKDSAWVLTAKVTVEPEVELGEYKGLEVAAQSTEVTDEDVDAELNRMREQQAELVLKEDAPAEKGDTVVIDFNGTIDGVPFEGGKSENYSLELGSNTFIPGFEDQLVGHKADEDVDVKVTFPEDYQAEDLQGKEAVFATKIHE
ncbi:trigger factor, partial [Ligilactobacillus ruminis]